MCMGLVTDGRCIDCRATKWTYTHCGIYKKESMYPQTVFLFQQKERMSDSPKRVAAVQKITPKGRLQSRLRQVGQRLVRAEAVQLVRWKLSLSYVWDSNQRPAVLLSVNMYRWFSRVCRLAKKQMIAQNHLPIYALRYLNEKARRARILSSSCFFYLFSLVAMYIPPI